MSRSVLMRQFWLVAVVVFCGFQSAARCDIVSTSFADNSLLRYSDTGAPLGVFVPPGGGGLSQPAGLALGADGNIYVSSQGTGDILKYNAQTGAFAGTFTSLGAGYQPAGMRFGPDGNLYVSQFGAASNTATVDRYNGTTGAFMGSVITGLTQPTGLMFDSSGNLYASALGQGRVVKYNGVTQSDFIAAGTSPLFAPSATAIGPDGNFYVVDLFGGAVLKYNPTTGAFISNFTGTALNGLFPSDLLFDSLGQMLVGNLGPTFATPTGNIERFNGTTGADLGDFSGPIWGASQLLFVPVPEPGVVALTLLGISVVALRCRKRSKATPVAA